MKVIAKVQDGKFLCEVTNREIKEFMNTFNEGSMNMRVGQIIDLGKGYDFARDAIDAMKKTNDFISSNKEVIRTIFEGIKIASVDLVKDSDNG